MSELTEAVENEFRVSIVAANQAVDLLVRETWPRRDAAIPNRRDTRHHHGSCGEPTGS